MVIIRRDFKTGGIDCDTSPKELLPMAFLNLENGRISVSENGRSKRLENCGGTTLISTSILPSGTHQTIGSTVWNERNMIIYFNWNSGGQNGIYAYDQRSGNSYQVLLSSQVSGGLNFSKASRINRNARVINGILYFTDGTTDGFKKVNIEAGIKMNHSGYVTTQEPYSVPVQWYELTVVVPPPAFPPQIQKEHDSSFANNFIANESFSFAYQVIYRDNEQSVVGTYSRASRLNKAVDTPLPYNRIAVKMDSQQFISNNVKIVRLLVRIGNKSLVVKTWDKSIASEKAEILAHNAGTTQLSYNFYNDITGEYLPDSDVLKPFDSVPLKTGTFEFVKGRLITGNDTEGYDAPKTTSLTHSITTNVLSTTQLNKNLIQVVIAGIGIPQYFGWYVLLTGTEASPAGYYVITSTEVVNATAPSAPASVAYTGLTYRGATFPDVINSVHTVASTSSDAGFINTTSYVIVTGISAVVNDAFKSRAQYIPCITFYDFAMRKCSAVRGGLITIPDRNFGYTSATQAVNVSLSNSNAFNEIPEWAHYYSIGRTLNLRTRFFVQGFDDAAKYVTKNSSGEYVFGASPTFTTSAVAIGIDTTSLVQAGLGYTYQEGDVCYLTTLASSHIELPVIGQSGKYVLLKPKDLGNLTGVYFSYELFSPYQASEQEPFFEVGNMYKVNNPTTTVRTYSVLSDVLLPDAYVISRNYNSVTYYAEAMCPNDAFYRRWDNDGGKVNFVTKLGQVSKPSGYSISNTFIQGTANNGLSTFEALNKGQLPLEAGAINGLTVASKFVGEGQGAVILANCAKRPISMYVGEAEISASSKQAFIVKTDGFIGSVNVLKGGGCINPETIISHDGLVFWVDANSGEVLQYSVNGADVISKYGMQRFFKSYLKKYLKTSASAIETLNGFSHIPTAIDPSFRREFLVITPALVNASAMTDLPSYTSTPSYALSIKNRFDVVDFQGKAMALAIDENMWHSYKFTAEWYENLNATMYGFKNGQIYIHDDDAVNTNTFYGVQQPLRIALAVNEITSGEKDAVNINIEGSVAPDYTVIYANDNNIQITDLAKAEFIKQEIAYFSKIYRDRLSPNASGTADEKLFTGDVVKGHPLYLMMEFQCNNGLMYVDAIEMGVNVSKGVESNIPKK